MNRRSTAAPLGGVAELSPDCATLTIALRGALDVEAEGMLRCLAEGASASGATEVCFDLSGIVRCDADGLRVLASTAAQMATSGVGVTVAPQSGSDRGARVDRAT